MAKYHRISCGEHRFQARSGQLLLDAALMSGHDLPHDCRAGRCGSCLTRIEEGITLGGETHQPGMVHACQARVFSDLAFAVELLPDLTRVRGCVVSVANVAEDIVEVAIEHDPLIVLPGQYCRFRFRGFPERPFSPTNRLDSIRDDRLLRLQIKRVRGGAVSSALGAQIKPGHSVTITGPFGHAFLRPARSSRLVLIGSGTGFAPVWAVAAAALRENCDREVVLIATSRRAGSCYVAPALDTVDRYPNVRTIGHIEGWNGDEDWCGGPIEEHVPQLSSHDDVYVAGGPAIVAQITELAKMAGATCYCDPFVPSAARSASLIEVARTWLMSS